MTCQQAAQAYNDALQKAQEARQQAQQLQQAYAQQQAQEQQQIASAQQAQAQAQTQMDMYRRAAGQFGRPPGSDPEADAKDRRTAQNFLVQTLKANPNNADAIGAMAYMSFQKGDCSAATAQARAAVRLNPDDRTSEGIAKMCAGRIGAPQGPDADNIRHSFDAKPGSDLSGPPDRGFGISSGGPSGGFPLTGSGPSRALLRDAYQKYQGKDYKSALLLLTQIIHDDPGNLSAWLLRARTSGALNNYDGAYQDLSHVLSVDPDNVDALALRAAASNHLHDYAAAIADADRALRLDAGNVQALTARALSYLRLHDYRRALDDASQAIVREPGNALAYIYRAMAEEGLGQVAEALKDFGVAASLDAALKPFYDEALQRIGGRSGGAVTGRRRALRRLFVVVSFAFVLIGLWGFGRTSTGRTITAKTLTWMKRRAGPAARRPLIGPVGVGDAPSDGNGERRPGSALRPGSVLGGNFRIVAELGRGGMGIVYEAFDETLQRKVAIKELQQDARTTAEDRARFLKEARVAARLKHPHLAEIHSFLEGAGGELYLVFEYLEGRSLDQVLAINGKLPPPIARRILGDVCAAVEYAHGQRIIHRDLKPSNVMVLADGSSKVMDFGIAHQIQTASSGTSTAASGTPPYMAPEQALGSVSTAADLYALGVMAYELLTGGLPFAGPDFVEQKMKKRFAPATRSNPALPPGFDPFFDSILEPDPTRRPADAAAFLRAFDAACVLPHPARTA